MRVHPLNCLSRGIGVAVSFSTADRGRVMPGWFRRAGVVLLTVSLLSAPSSAAAGPETYDVRRSAIYGIDADIGSDCDIDPVQDIELEWDGSRISWTFVDVTSTGGEGGWRVIGTYRVPE